MSLAFHQILLLCILASSILLCCLVYIFGSFLRAKKTEVAALPAVPLFPPSAFPTVFDSTFTLFLMLFFAHNCVLGLQMESNSDNVGWDDLLASLLIYVPMLIRYFCLPRRSHLPAFRQGALSIICALGCIYAASFLYDASGLSSWIQTQSGSPELQDVMQYLKDGNREQKLIICISAVIIAPVAEECCFRGFIYNILKQKAGIPAAALTSGIFFGIIHMGLPQLLPLSLFGIAQCWVYEKAKSLWAPICLHFIFNSISIAAAMLFGFDY